MVYNFYMGNITAIVPFYTGPYFEKLIKYLSSSPFIERIFILHNDLIFKRYPKSEILNGENFQSTDTILKILNSIQTDFFLFIIKPNITSFEAMALERLMIKTKDYGVAMVYSDFYDELCGQKFYHPLNDYQLGSVRDDFDFGSMILFSMSKVKCTLKEYGLLSDLRWGGLYDLRLKLSIRYSIIHINEPLYTVEEGEKTSFNEKLFSYVNPLNLKIQREMEGIFTDYLKRIGAYIPSQVLKKIEPSNEFFPVEASIIIPVKNRKETILDSINSALSQETNFPFNIIVIDNHSTDGTTNIISELSKKDSRLKHLIPKRKDLCIGGCWNEALNSPYCGRFAIQLDSDDLYSNTNSLKKMVDKLREESFAMVVGSYTLVNSDLREIPPGLIEHREWTDENGHNNALRINGIGAPRGFHTSIMRKIGFLNVSYGEDYAAALRISREFKIGRIYENLYLCRRWPGNSDSNPSLEDINQKNAFKDRIRTEEILSRQKWNQGGL